ncbi:MAG: Fic family protein, partial [Polaribacter sp.]
NQLRYLWTHTSTSLEGNTLSLGETKFVIEEGLTISGKSLKDHQEVAYNNIHEPLFFSHLIFLSLLFMD